MDCDVPSDTDSAESDNETVGHSVPSQHEIQDNDEMNSNTDTAESEDADVQSATAELGVVDLSSGTDTANTDGDEGAFVFLALSLFDSNG